MELIQLYEASKVPLFDMDAEGYYAFADMEKYGWDCKKIPGYLPWEEIEKYAKAEVTEVSWHMSGIAVRFYKGDEDE